MFGPVPPLGLAVSHVVGVCPKEEMAWADAGWLVAVMAYAQLGWNGSYEELVRNAMGL
jgi:hypothetical protein